MAFVEDDKLWADLEQLTLDSGTESLSVPTEFHRWNDLPIEMLRAIMQQMEFGSLSDSMIFYIETSETYLECNFGELIGA